MDNTNIVQEYASWPNVWVCVGYLNIIHSQRPTDILDARRSYPYLFDFVTQFSMYKAKLNSLEILCEQFQISLETTGIHKWRIGKLQLVSLFYNHY